MSFLGQARNPSPIVQVHAGSRVTVRRNPLHRAVPGPFQLRGRMTLTENGWSYTWNRGEWVGQRVK